MLREVHRVFEGFEWGNSNVTLLAHGEQEVIKRLAYSDRERNVSAEKAPIYQTGDITTFHIPDRDMGALLRACLGS